MAGIYGTLTVMNTPPAGRIVPLFKFDVNGHPDYFLITLWTLAKAGKSQIPREVRGLVYALACGIPPWAPLRLLRDRWKDGPLDALAALDHFFGSYRSPGARQRTAIRPTFHTDPDAFREPACWMLTEDEAGAVMDDVLTLAGITDEGTDFRPNGMVPEDYYAL